MLKIEINEQNFEILSQAIQKVGSELYKAQQEAQKQDEKNPDVEAPDVEEGEIEEDKKEEKK